MTSDHLEGMDHLQFFCQSSKVSNTELRTLTEDPINLNRSMKDTISVGREFVLETKTDLEGHAEWKWSMILSHVLSAC